MGFNDLMNSTKKINLIISITVLLGTLFSSQAIPVTIAQETVLLAVNGTLMRGLELEPNLVNLERLLFVKIEQSPPTVYTLLTIYILLWYVSPQPMQLMVYLLL
jgi:hypothetical protein